MRKLLLTLALAVSTIIGTQAQNAGDWYVGTGDVANALEAKRLKGGRRTIPIPKQ